MKIQIAAPAINGRANNELVRYVAELAGVPRSNVRILLGEGSPVKLLESDGVHRDLFSRSDR